MTDKQKLIQSLTEVGAPFTTEGCMSYEDTFVEYVVGEHSVCAYFDCNGNLLYDVMRDYDDIGN